MVHALQEVRRVLVPGGLLVDLRPLLDRWPVEVAWSSGSREAGRATDLEEPLADDAAANAAMRTLPESGGWSLEAQDSFPLLYYWETPKEMQEYISDEWDDVIAIEDSVWAALRSAWATAAADARPRLRMKMLIARYRRLGRPQP